MDESSFGIMGEIVLISRKVKTMVIKWINEEEEKENWRPIERNEAF